MDMTGWNYLLTFGEDLDVYRKGDDRVGISKTTGEVVIRYQVEEEK